MAHWRSFRHRVDSGAIAALALCVMAAVMLWLAAGALFAARAQDPNHGDPAHFWISANPNYKRVGGYTHCCGPNHCGIIAQDAIEAILDKDGLIYAWRVRENGQIFRVGQPHALYDSIDAQHWGCHDSTGGYHCIFIRQVGG